MGRFMLVFTVEVELEPVMVEGFGDVSDEMAGFAIERQLAGCTKNATWACILSFPKNEYWTKQKKTDINIEWKE